MDNPAFKKERFTDCMAWEWLIHEASFEPHEVRVNYEMITVKRGQIPTSYRKLKDAWGWGNGRIIKTLLLWKNSGMLEINQERGLTVITICNYDKYQKSAKETGTHLGTEVETQVGTRVGTNINKGKELKEGKINIVGTRFSLQDPPSEWIQFCQTQRPDLNPGIIFDAFRDYWIAKPGKDGIKLDWLATWRNWVRNQKTTNGVNLNGKPKTKLDLIAEGVAKARAERESRARQEAG